MVRFDERCIKCEYSLCCQTDPKAYIVRCNSCMRYSLHYSGFNTQMKERMRERWDCKLFGAFNETTYILACPECFKDGKGW